MKLTWLLRSVTSTRSEFCFENIGGYLVVRASVVVQHTSTLVLRFLTFLIRELKPDLKKE
jgi:hypothetical protein